jgi:hypothetical protein
MPRVVAIKIAPFNRYQTLDVLRAVADSGRADEIALYTGNDDSIVADLVTPFRFGDAHAAHRRRPAGALGRLDVAGGEDAGTAFTRRCAVKGRRRRG